MTNSISIKNIEELKSLLILWEDGCISDYRYCNKVGKILGLKNWTFKGAKNGSK